MANTAIVIEYARFVEVQQRRARIRAEFERLQKIDASKLPPPIDVTQIALKLRF